MCLAQGPQRSDAGEAQTRGPSVSSQALYHWATALPQMNGKKILSKAHLINFKWNDHSCKILFLRHNSVGVEIANFTSFKEQIT